MDTTLRQPIRRARVPSPSNHHVDSVSAALRSVAIQGWLSTVAVLSGLVVPLLGVWLLRRVSAGRRPWQATAIWFSGCFSLLVYASAAYVFGVCWGGEVGESGKNRLARALGTPVIAALEEYHRARGVYPDSLEELIPSYLTPSALRAPEKPPLGHPFEYRADSGRYELTVRYTGPGMNTCRYEPGSAWRCSGYF